MGVPGLAVLLLASTSAVAQRGGGHMGGGGLPRGGGMPTLGGHGGGFPEAGPRLGGVDRRSPNMGNGNTVSTVRGGLQLGPPGRWWDDKNFARSLNLRKEQQTRMDSAFNANKAAILESYKVLQDQEAKLEAATRESKLDEAKIFAAIDGVNQARSALQKANAHMLLQVRAEMDPEQVQTMEKIRETPAEE
jgi:Spy/CpxP family protein refolding chaperone